MSKTTDSIVYIGDAYTETDDYKSHESIKKSLFDKRKSSRINTGHLKGQLSSSRLRQQKELTLRVDSREGTYYEIGENTSEEDMSERTSTQSSFRMPPMPRKYLIFCIFCGIVAVGSVIVAAVVSALSTAPGPCVPLSLQPCPKCTTNNKTEPVLPLQCLNFTVFNESWRLRHNGSDLKPGKNGSYACDLHKDIGWFKFSGAGGNKMLNTCPKWKSCGAYAPMWTDSPPPDTVGVISNVTTYSVHGDNCWHSPTQLKVMRCSWDNPADLVYKYNGFHNQICEKAFCGMF